MSSLYRRATPSQAHVLRIVEDAVKNASDAHPEIKISPQHRRSIAKRAAGTLTAQWPEVLAVPRHGQIAAQPVNYDTARGARGSRVKPLGRGGSDLPRASPLGRFPLRQLIREISRPIRGLKETGQTDRAEALIDVLKIISRLRGAI